MKNFIKMNIVIIIILAIINCSPKDCKKFQTGKFEFQSKYVGKILIERDANYQTETIVDSGAVARLKIKWLDDCTFLMFERKLIKGKEPFDDPKEIEEMNQDTIINEIIEIKGDEYKTRSKIYNTDEDWYYSTTKKIK